MKAGDKGTSVGRLHAALARAGLAVSRDEAADAAFGSTTAQALEVLQRRFGLEVRGDVDEAALVELEQRVTLNVYEPGGSARTTPALDPTRGEITGTLTDGDGVPIAELKVEAFSKKLRAETALGQATTSKKGAFKIRYRRDPEAPPNVLVRAVDDSGNVLATSSTTFSAPATISVALGTAAGTAPRALSRFATVLQRVTAQLDGVKLDSLEENSKTQDLHFVANASGVSFREAAFLFIAQLLSEENALRAETLFGLFARGIPSALGASLGSLPEAGIDEAFAAQVLSGVLKHTRSALSAALTAAVSRNILPASYADTMDLELVRLDDLRVAAVGAAPYVRGKTTLSDLLAAGGVASAAQQAFRVAYALGEPATSLWKSLEANPTLTDADRATLSHTLNAGSLLSGNVPLVKDTVERLAGGRLTRIDDLAQLDQQDWVARITEIDPRATSIPSVLPNDTPTTRIARFATTISERLARRFPTTAIGAALSKSTTTTFKTKTELGAFLINAADFNLSRTHIDAYMAAHPKALSAAAVLEAKTLQRLQRVVPSPAYADLLHTAGYTSAQSIYFAGESAFVAKATSLLGTATRAKTVYARAQTMYATALTTFTRFNAQLNGPRPPILGPHFPTLPTVTAFADVQALFGSQDYFTTTDCQTVLSPAAYLVDLLVYLQQLTVTPSSSGVSILGDEWLLQRRPDIGRLALSCANTNTTLPYIDVVNDVLEWAVGFEPFVSWPHPPPPGPIDTLGTSAERRAIPQIVFPPYTTRAYDVTSAAVYPLTLPFHLPFAQTEAYVAALSTVWSSFLALFDGTPGAVDGGFQACASLGINPSLRPVLTTDGTVGVAATPWVRWGFAAPEPVDPSVFNPPPSPPLPTPITWTAALAYVPLLLQRSGLRLQELFQLLAVNWVTRGTVILQYGIDPSMQQPPPPADPILSAGVQFMQISGLTAEILDRINRFVRLVRVTGCSMWELDWAIGQYVAQDVTDGFLEFLAGAQTVRTQLSLPFQEVLAFWADMGTADATNYLGSFDVTVPSTYSEVFANPTMQKTWPGMFPAAGSSAAFPSLVAATPAITAALGLSASEIQAVLIATSLASATTVTIHLLTELFRYQRLAKACSVPVADLPSWIALTATDPFTASPADTLEFVRRLGLLRSLGLTVTDLQYLLFGKSGTASKVAFTDAQMVALVQSMQAALAKLDTKDPLFQEKANQIIVAAITAAIPMSGAQTQSMLTALGVEPALVGLPSLAAPTLTNLTGAAYLPIVTALTAIAKASVIGSALGLTDVEFQAVLDGAAQPGWLNLAALPTAAPSAPAALYTQVEALLQVTPLFRTQTALFPKLIDVLALWRSTPPTSIDAAVAGPAPAVPGTQTAGLALALNASVNDVTALLAAMKVTSAAWGVAGSLATVPVLAALARALDRTARYNVGGPVLASLVTAPASVSDWTAAAAAAQAILQAQFPQPAWYATVQPVEDGLREARRDALVAALLGGNTKVSTTIRFQTVDDIYNYFLIDPEMSACAITTRLLEASLAVQQLMQQAFLNLPLGMTVTMPADVTEQWSWRSQYRLWQANREVFLYPENYLLPELRHDATSLFTDLESDLQQNTCDADLAETAIENYLRQLVEVGTLCVIAHYNQPMLDGSTVLHVFARTRGTPWKWYYRTRTTYASGAADVSLGPGTWSPWVSLSLDITSDHLVPVVWDRRLHLVWPVFKYQSEKPTGQKIPDTSGGGTQPAAAQYWSVDLCVSELRAGEWQAKRVVQEKFFFAKTYADPTDSATDRQKLGFMFNAQESNGDLLVRVYYTPTQAEAKQSNGDPPTELVAWGRLPTLDDPMSVWENQDYLPDANDVDVSQDPSFASVNGYVPTSSSPYPTPEWFGYSGQDLVTPNYYSAPFGFLCVVNVLATEGGAPSTVSAALLNTVMNPRIVVPQQEVSGFDCQNPFFVVDAGSGFIEGSAATGVAASPRPGRTYLVDPVFLGVVGSSGMGSPMPAVAQGQNWYTQFQFTTFYHPYARVLIRALEEGGVGALLDRDLQRDPGALRQWATPFDFASTFKPNAQVAPPPYPGDLGPPAAADVGERALDFQPGNAGPMSEYNWEVFYHVPMYTASLLLANQQFSEALTWLEYVFNPTDTSSSGAPEKYWQFAPFFSYTAPDWTNSSITGILNNFATGTPTVTNAASLYVMQNDPFDPHAIAQLRPEAYARATLMRVFDTLIAWGDSLFATYTSESVSQAEQLYILADMLLGPAPNAVPPPKPVSPLPNTYDSIKDSLGLFSNALTSVENLVVPPPPSATGSASAPSLPHYPAVGSQWVFSIPPNSQFLGYWGTVADRLYKIRHCMNLQGQIVPLPLYAPPINPLLLAQGANGATAGTTLTNFIPVYRFNTYFQKAVEVANDARSFNALVLAASEKGDGEDLAALRATHELSVQTKLLDVKTAQVQEATDQIAALQAQLAVEQIRYNFYSTIQYMIQWETQAFQLQAKAYSLNAIAMPLDLEAGLLRVMPTIQSGVAGAGGSPTATLAFGPENLAAAASTAASAFRAQAGLVGEQASMVATQAQYQRRWADWQLQANLAKAQMTQITAQLTAAQDRLTAAIAELALQNLQISNAQAISDFLTNKYTSSSLYTWLLNQLMPQSAQMYQIAYSLAKQAEAAYGYELATTATFIQPTYWDSQHRGLGAAEGLLLDLRRMESAFLAANTREFELTKAISLAMINPLALVQLRETGTCTFSFDEVLFEMDHPGQFYRRLRSVALTITSVAGPYTGVNASLTLQAAAYRFAAPTTPGKLLTGADLGPGTVNDANAVPSPSPGGNPRMQVVTSRGDNDPALFDVNLRDERWLPFEGHGAISTWSLSLLQDANSFDFSTITDVVFHVRYTARYGMDPATALNNVVSATGKQKQALLSVNATYPDAFYAFMNPESAAATSQLLTLPVTAGTLPFSNIGTGGKSITGLSVVFLLANPLSSPTTMQVTFDVATATTPASLTLSAPGTFQGGTITIPGTLGGDVASPTVPLTPQSMTLTVQSSAIPSALQMPLSSPPRLNPAIVEDVLLVFQYTVA